VSTGRVHGPWTVTRPANTARGRGRVVCTDIYSDCTHLRADVSK